MILTSVLPSQTGLPFPAWVQHAHHLCAHSQLSASLTHASSFCTAHRVSGRHFCRCPSVFTLRKSFLSAIHFLTGCLNYIYLIYFFPKVKILHKPQSLSIPACMLGTRLVLTGLWLARAAASILHDCCWKWRPADEASCPLCCLIAETPWLCCHWWDGRPRGLTWFKSSIPCLDLPGFRELENVLTLTIPTLTTPGPAAGR